MNEDAGRGGLRAMKWLEKGEERAKKEARNAGQNGVEPRRGSGLGRAKTEARNARQSGVEPRENEPE